MNIDWRILCYRLHWMETSSLRSWRNTQILRKGERFSLFGCHRLTITMGIMWTIWHRITDVICRIWSLKSPFLCIWLRMRQRGICSSWTHRRMTLRNRSLCCCLSLCLLWGRISITRQLRGQHKISPKRVHCHWTHNYRPGNQSKLKRFERGCFSEYARYLNG